MNSSSIQLCLVCTGGGHFEQMTNLAECYCHFDHFWITNKTKQTECQLAEEKKYYIKSAHFTRPWTYLLQLPGVIRSVLKERPTHFLCTGSGKTALVPFLVAKALGKPFIHIDTFSIVNGYSKFGNFLLKLNHPIFSQWKGQQNEKVIYIGPIFTNPDKVPKRADHGHVFVTVGTREEPFTRLIQAVEDLAKKGIIQEKIIVQAGHTPYRSDLMQIFDFCTPDEIDQYIGHAKYVITQESAGIGTKCLKLETPFLVMPREFRYRELPAKTDMREDLHMKLEEMGYTKVVHSAPEIEAAINDLHKIRTGFVFDNHRAIATLNRIIEKNPYKS